VGPHLYVRYRKQSSVRDKEVFLPCASENGLYRRGAPEVCCGSRSLPFSLLPRKSGFNPWPVPVVDKWQ